MIIKTAPRSSRFAAIETLHQLKKTRLPVSHIFERIIIDCDLSRPDRHLAMKICYGVLRQRDYIDHLMSLLCRQPIAKIKPFVYHALSVGLYQLFYLDRIPPSAAVNETVNAVRAANLPKPLQGFVNGVLRESIRKKNELPGPSVPFLNHPNWITDRWAQHYGQETMRQICSFNNKEASTWLRVTHRTTVKKYLERLTSNNIYAKTGPYASESILLPDFQGGITGLPGFHEGFFQVQDQSAQLATLLFGPFSKNESYLDCCAGVGGKTMHLASLLHHNKSSITALEPTPARFRQLKENIARTSEDKKITLYNETLERFSRSCMTRFDRILVDAPCSGTGVIGRQPDIRWNRDLNDLETYSHRQFFLLKEAAKLLQPGGVLIYATCSIEPEENSFVVDRFLEENRKFTLSDCRLQLPPKAHSLVRDNCFAPLPHQGTDGFFAARLVLAE